MDPNTGNPTSNAYPMAKVGEANLGNTEGVKGSTLERSTEFSANTDIVGKNAGGSLRRTETLSALQSGDKLNETQMRDVSQAIWQNAAPYEASLNRPITLKEDPLLDDLPRSEVKSASVLTLVALSGPKMAAQMAWSAQWAAIGPYLQNLLPSWAVQVTQLVGPLCGFIIAPVVGVASDRSENKFGRRRPWLLAGGILSAICWTIMGFTKEIGEALGDTGTNRTWTATFTIITYVWMDITVNVMATPAQLLLADYSGDRQFLGTAIGQAAATLGSLLISVWFMVFGNPSLLLHWFLGFLAVVMLITVIVACIVAKEKPFVLEGGRKEGCGAMVSGIFGPIFASIRHCPTELWWILGAWFLFVYGSMSYGGSKGQFFGIVVYGGDPVGADICGQKGNPPCTPQQDAYNAGVAMAGGLTDFIANICGFLFSFCIPFIVKKIGSKTAWMVLMIPQVLWIIMAFVHVVAVDVILVVLGVLSGTAMYSLIYPVTVHIVSDKDNNGAFFGLTNMVGCLGQFINFFLAAFLVQTSLGYAFPILLGGILSALGILCLFIGYKSPVYSM